MIFVALLCVDGGMMWHYVAQKPHKLGLDPDSLQLTHPMAYVFQAFVLHLQRRGDDFHTHSIKQTLRAG